MPFYNDSLRLGLKRAVMEKIQEKSTDLYRWLIVSALTLVMTGFYGAYLSFAVFLKPILQEFGWSRTTVSGAISIAGGISGLMGIVSGRLTDKYGARLLIVAGALMGVVGYLLIIWMTKVWQFYIYFGIVVGASFSVCWTPVTATVSRFFSKKRALALGVTTSGITIGHMLVPPLLAVLIELKGWRLGYFILAVIICISAIPAIFILGKKISKSKNTVLQSEPRNMKYQDKSEGLEQQPVWTVAEAAKTLSFWILLLTGFVTAAGFFFVAVHIIAYATDIGIDIHSAALILTFMGGANILGKLLTPQIVLKIGSRFTLMLLLGLQAVVLFLLIWAQKLWIFFILSSIFGFGFGASSPLRMTIIAEFFGLKSIGTMIGIIEIAWSIGAITGPVMAGYVFDLSGSYDIAFLTGGLIVLAGTVSAYFIKRPLQRTN